MNSLIIGGGQLGRSLRQSLGDDAMIVNGLPWGNPPDAHRRIADAATKFSSTAAGRPWLVCWSAGSGVVGTAESSLHAERDALQTLIAAVAAAPGFDPQHGSFFLASSAGGIYGSGDGSAMTEESEPRPTSDYGRSKLAQDEIVTEWAAQHGVRTLIGRISNLYGPRQDVRKPQGFISHLCRAMAHRSLFTLTVPVSTIRDFVFTDDVADRVARWAIDPPVGPGRAEIKLLAAGRSVTLGHIIAMTTAISRSPARVLLASRPGPNEQPASLRFQSRVLTHLDRACPGRSLEAGIRATWQSALLGLQTGRG